MSIQRHFDRHGRFSWQGEGEKPKGVLDAFNESNASGTRFLHHTKGFRKYSVRRGKAQMITEEIKRGMFPLTILSFVQVRNILLDQRAG